MDEAKSGERSLLARLGWFAALWAGSVLALGVVAYGIRLLIRLG